MQQKEQSWIVKLGMNQFDKEIRMIPEHHRTDFDALVEYYRTFLRKFQINEVLAIWSLLKNVKIPSNRKIERAEVIKQLIENAKQIEVPKCSERACYKVPGNQESLTVKLYPPGYMLSGYLVWPNFVVNTIPYFATNPKYLQAVRHILIILNKSLLRQCIGQIQLTEIPNPVPRWFEEDLYRYCDLTSYVRLKKEDIEDIGDLLSQFIGEYLVIKQDYEEDYWISKHKTYLFRGRHYNSIFREIRIFDSTQNEYFRFLMDEYGKWLR